MEKTKTGGRTKGKIDKDSEQDKGMEEGKIVMGSRIQEER